MADNSDHFDEKSISEYCENKLKKLAAKQIEHSIAKALTDLAGFPFICAIESIQFGDRLVNPTKIILSASEKIEYNHPGKGL